MPEEDIHAISLALATYNQAALLRIFLDRFRSMAPKNLPLIIVDDGSTDGTSEILGKEYLPANCLSVRIDHAGAAAARNRALRLCETPWLAFTDTDCLLDEDYLQNLSAVPALYPHAAAVEGAVLAPPMPKPPLMHWLENPSGGQFATANMMVNVSLALAIQGFDERFPSNLREDTDFGLRLWAAYGPIPFHPALRVNHPYIPKKFAASFFRAWNRQRQTVSAERRLYAKHPAAYARVRRLKTAEATIGWWRKRHVVFFAKQTWPWVKAQSRLGLAAGCQAWIRYGGGIVLAAWEQACTQIVSRWPAIRKDAP